MILSRKTDQVKSVKMKTKLLKLFTIIFSQLTYGHIDINNYGGCFVIQFLNRKSVVPDTAILPVYQEHGFQIIENGVYDFVIDGKK